MMFSPSYRSKAVFITFGIIVCFLFYGGHFRNFANRFQKESHQWSPLADGYKENITWTLMLRTQGNVSLHVTTPLNVHSHRYVSVLKLNTPVERRPSTRIIKSVQFNDTRGSSYYVEPVVKSPTGKVTSFLNISDTYVVPNIVHYVWFGKNKIMEFHHMLSIKSTFLYIQPDKLFLHCDNLPVGRWWDYLMSSVNLTIRHMDAPVSVFGIQLHQVIHKSDIARMDILSRYGGIYLDTDVVALKSFDRLRRYEFTMGIEYHKGDSGRLNNGIIVSTTNASFLSIWKETFRNLSQTEHDFHSCIVPYHMMFKYPHLIHVEEKTLNFPSGLRMDLIYDKVYDWSRNYAMHLWNTMIRIIRGREGRDLMKHDLEDIKRLNTTFGQIARYVIYGTKDFIK